MSQFSYVALEEGGAERKGDLEASDARSAAVMLRRQGLFVMELKTQEPGPASAENAAGRKRRIGDFLASARRSFGELRPVRDRDRILFLQQAALMLRSGLTLVQCLEEASHTTSKPRFAAALGRIGQAIRSGKSFSQAVTGEGLLFPVIVVKLIESAEASGEMDTILDQLAAHLEQKAQVQMNLLTSLTYPAIVLLTAVGVVAFLIVKVIPKFAKFFVSRHAELPWSTRFLIDLASFVQSKGLFLLGGLAGALAALLAAYASPGGRRRIDRGLLKLPIVGKLLKGAAMAHIGRTLAILLRSGVTLFESLQIAGGIAGNREIAACMERASEQILAGKDLAAGLRHPVIPPLVSQVVAVGERTGALVHVLEELGLFYDRQVQAMTKRMSALIEPVLILIIGGMVGFVYYAFFQAIFRLATAGR